MNNVLLKTVRLSWLPTDLIRGLPIISTANFTCQDGEQKLFLLFVRKQNFGNKTINCSRFQPSGGGVRFYEIGKKQNFARCEGVVRFYEIGKKQNFAGGEGWV